MVLSLEQHGFVEIIVINGEPVIVCSGRVSGGIHGDLCTVGPGTVSCMF